MRSMLPIEPEALREFCTRHSIRRLSLFGSRLTGEPKDESDIDLLVEFEPGREPGLLGLSAMQEELSSLAGGLEIDLRTPQDLSRHFRDKVLHTAEVQFARG